MAKNFFVLLCVVVVLLGVTSAITSQWKELPPNPKTGKRVNAATYHSYIVKVVLDLRNCNERLFKLCHLKLIVSKSIQLVEKKKGVTVLVFEILGAKKG